MTEVEKDIQLELMNCKSEFTNWRTPFKSLKYAELLARNPFEKVEVSRPINLFNFKLLKQFKPVKKEPQYEATI